MVTTTLSPVSCMVTRTLLPSGRLEWAAVMAFWSKIAPLLVRRPWKWVPYQDACPLSSQPGDPPIALSARPGRAHSIIDAIMPGRKRAADLIIQVLVALRDRTKHHLAPKINR